MEQNMILIKDIEVVVVPNNYVYTMYEKMGNPSISYGERDYLEKELKITKELIRGERFVNTRGETVYIGMTKQVQDTIGLSFQTLNNLTKFNRELQRDLNNTIADKKKVEEKIKKINSYGFLTKLKYLFTKQLN
jgi:hypothetical protein